MAHIYKLQYQDKAEAIADLKVKGCLDEDGVRMPLPTHNVVFIGKIVETTATYDDEGNQLTAPKFKEGYHVDVMDEREDLVFNAERTYPENPYHKLSGK